VPTVVALDAFLTDSSSLADVVLPAAAFAEKAGSTTNLEGRVTALTQRVNPAGTARPDWMVAAELADLLGLDDLAASLSSVAAVTAAIAKTVPAYAGATPAALDGAREGVVAVNPAAPAGIDVLGDFRVADRNSYDYRLVVSRTLYDLATATAHAPSLAPLDEPAVAFLNPADVDKLGVVEGADVRLSGARGDLVVPVRADAGVPRGIVRVPFNHDGGAVSTLIDASGDVTDVRIEAVAT
jgi:predicted molibdopterin-dependent oxidoreductase YjgC